MQLLHFVRDTGDLRRAGRTSLEPAVLIVAPLSGHHATLLRGTVQAFLQDHEVYVTDWSNARDVPMLDGRFDFHDYIDHVRDMIRAIWPRPHVVAVCQPGPPVLAAASLMAEDEDPARPASLTFMGSPIDARLSPTVANRLAEERPFTWFQRQMIYTVPPPYPGVLRRVYPGFVQLYSFMQLNLERHMEAHQRYFDASGEAATATPPTSTWSSTTSTSRSWTSPRSSICRPSRSCSSSTSCPRASSPTAAVRSGRRRSPTSGS